MRRIGHKGADHIAPGNTPASFDAALAHGVHMIEFDVLPDRRTGRQAGLTEPLVPPPPPLRSSQRGRRASGGYRGDHE